MKITDIPVSPALASINTFMTMTVVQVTPYQSHMLHLVIFMLLYSLSTAFNDCLSDRVSPNH